MEMTNRRLNLPSAVHKSENSEIGNDYLADKNSDIHQQLRKYPDNLPLAFDRIIGKPDEEQTYHCRYYNTKQQYLDSKFTIKYDPQDQQQ